jgi:hypothetical protein
MIVDCGFGMRRARRFFQAQRVEMVSEIFFSKISMSFLFSLTIVNLELMRIRISEAGSTLCFVSGIL